MVRQVRVAIHVRPGAKITAVGGCHDGALVVRVSARAVDGKATEGALKALAEGLGVAARDVVLVSGATSRRKLVDIPNGARSAYEALREGPASA